MRAKADRAAVHTSSLEIIPCPKPFRVSGDWKSWKQQMENYLALQSGNTGIPLSYVIRPMDDPLEGEELR